MKILEPDKFLAEEMKVKVSTEYFRKVLEVKVKYWEFSSNSWYLGSSTFKIFSNIYKLGKARVAGYRLEN